MDSTPKIDNYYPRDLTSGTFRLVGVLTAAMAILLNHSMHAVGFNMSLADLFFVIILFILLTSQQLYIPRYSILFFIALLVVTVGTALWITPNYLGVHPVPRDAFGDVVKLLISLLYFIMGVNIVRLGLQNRAMRWFAIGSAFIALLGTLMEITGVRILTDTLYYDNLRFRGFMSDPNFYAILSCAGFVYFAYEKHLSPVVRSALLLLLAFSIIISGSKTGLLVLLVIITVILITRTRNSESAGPATLLAVGSTLLLFFLDPIRNYLVNLAERFSTEIPQLDRISLLLSSDPSESFSQDGSSREAMWEIGVGLIGESPIVGVGVGAYSNVADALFGNPGLAHNTYIQLAAEWGVVLASVLFIWIFFLLFQASRKGKRGYLALDLVIARDVLLVFLLGSLSLSLNNARMLWLFLGILAGLCYLHEISRKDAPVW